MFQPLQIILQIPQDPIFGTWYYLSFLIIFFEGSTRYQMQPENVLEDFLGL
jgi:hypothetical protein